MGGKIGYLRFDFINEREVKITDSSSQLKTITNEREKLHLRAFPLLLVSKLLCQLEPKAASSALDRAIEKIGGRGETANMMSEDSLLLGLFTKTNLILLTRSICGGRWVYKACLKTPGEFPELKIKNSRGNESYFRRATMSTAVEYLMMKFLALGEDEDARSTIWNTMVECINSFLVSAAEEREFSNTDLNRITLDCISGALEKLAKVDGVQLDRDGVYTRASLHASLHASSTPDPESCTSL